MDGQLENVGGPPLRPRGIGEILGTALDLYRRHWPTLVAIVAVVAIPLSLIEYYVADEVLARTVRLLPDGSLVISGGAWRAYAGSALLGVVSFFVWFVLEGAITRAAVATLVGEDLGMDASYRYGLARLGSVLLVAILTGLAVMGGLILLVVPGIFFAVRFSCAVPALVVEDRRGRAALSRSWNLVRGRGWHVFGAFLVAGLIAGLVASVLTAPFSDDWFVRGLLGGLASVITTPFTVLVLSVVYLDVRVRKEQVDGTTLRMELRASTP